MRLKIGSDNLNSSNSVLSIYKIDTNITLKDKRKLFSQIIYVSFFFLIIPSNLTRCKLYQVRYHNSYKPVEQKKKQHY